MRPYAGLITWLLGVAFFFLIFTYMAHGDTCCERHPEGVKCYPC